MTASANEVSRATRPSTILLRFPMTTTLSTTPRSINKGSYDVLVNSFPSLDSSTSNFVFVSNDNYATFYIATNVGFSYSARLRIFILMFLQQLVYAVGK